MNTRSTTIITALVVAAAPLACTPDDTDSIAGVGTLELVELDVAPTTTARLVRVVVAEGDYVRAGDTVAVLAVPTLDADLAAAVAGEAAARANLAELHAGALAREVERAEAELAARQADLARLADDSARIAPLVPKALASDAQLVAARNAVLAAAAARDAAHATLELLRDGTRSERIAQARAQLDRARAGVSAVRATANDLVLLAGVDGLVITRSAEPGEMLAAGRPVVTIADTRRPWVRVFLGPQHVPLVNIGDTATATLDAFPERPFIGRVTSIATRAEFTPRVALTERERADLMYAVRVDFADTTAMLKAGLPVTVRFPPRESRQ